MDIVLLEPDDAEYVETLAGYHYPPNYPMSFEDILDNLQKADEKSFCYGVEDEGKLTGYMMAWVENTLIEGKRERVLLVDDLVLSIKARGVLFRLLQTMISQMEERGFKGLPIEGSARPSSTHTFLGHSDAFERLGYELTMKSEYYEEEFEESLTWVRFEPIERVAATIDTDDQLDIEFVEDNP